MSYTYPAAPVGLTQGATATEVHQFMKSPALLARRLQTILSQRYIADYLLTGRFTAVGGSILYPDGQESLFTADDPEAISVGGEYPLTTLDEGTLQLTRTVKWGRDVEIFDESIARYLIDPVTRALTRLANHNVRYIDSAALGVIASKVTQTKAASTAWTAAPQIIEDILSAKAQVDELNLGYDLSTVVLRPTQYAKVMARLVTSGLLPRESVNPINTGEFPSYLGITWTTSTNVPVTDPLLVDRSVLGGMADEDLGGPGYVRATNGVGIEAKTMRLDGTDGYRVRARRVTVPVVIEPLAGIRITGTGI